jgi:hypothetical protein
VARVASWTATSCALLLIGFHALIFWRHLLSGALADPGKGLAWAIGFVLFGFMVALRRAGVPLLWGRRALVVWIMVALLHVGALKPGHLDATALGTATDATLSLFTLPPSIVSLAALAGLLLVLLSAGRRRRAPLALAVAVVRARAAHRPVQDGLFAPLPSRAPPLAARWGC